MKLKMITKWKCGTPWVCYKCGCKNTDWICLNCEVGDDGTKRATV